MAKKNETEIFIALVDAYTFQHPILRREHLESIAASAEPGSPLEGEVGDQVVWAASTAFESVLKHREKIEWPKVRAHVKRCIAKLQKQGQMRQRARKETKNLPRVRQPRRRPPQRSINESMLRALADQVESFPPRLWSGLSSRRLQETGVYEGEGLSLKKEDLPLGQLYAGLTVLARDMHDYLSQNPRSDSMNFEEIVTEVRLEDRAWYRQGAFPIYEGQDVSQLPTGLAAKAATGDPTVRGLGEPAIVHEWTVKPGKKLFLKFVAKFGSKLKETICGKEGPYEQFNKGLLGQKSLPTTIAASILTVGFSSATFWYPLAIYIAILLVKAGLKTYCEPSKKKESARGRSRSRSVLK
jgi:hypothetical protein